MSERIAVIGLGYVGLPVALAFARKFDHVVGFDIDLSRVKELRAGDDRTREATSEELSTSTLRYTTDLEDLRESTFFVVTVPTPIDANRFPDLGPVRRATESVAKVLRPGAVVVYESTVYPGVTEEICGPLLEKHTGMKAGVDFFLGYSPERINPGDREHTLARVTKIVAGDSPETLARVAAAYGTIVDVGLHLAPTIRVAEAAKVVENTQRDLNIALMNELALIFDRLDISTRDVLAAARTKWNFLPFSPGLVGGHCIGVDPYYLTAKAEAVGYRPEVILAGRRINDGMGQYVAQRMVKQLIRLGTQVKGARVGVLGLTFKENVPDVRNSRVPDVVRELQAFGIEPVTHDPRADADHAEHEFGFRPGSLGSFENLDGLIFAVAHREYLAMGAAALLAMLRPGGVLVDVRSALDRNEIPDSYVYWSL
jgi:UDP-N-acetyl-D-galactosamine dehydrogenase